MTRARRIGPNRLPAAIVAFAVMIIPLALPTAASAAPVLTVKRVTWNVVGLDSNDVTTGPNVFPVGARVCNTGDAPATNLSADFVWDTANGFINLSGASSISLDSLAAGSCADFNFDVVITRSAAAYDTTRRYHIDVTADGLGTVSTNTPREIYVEHLVSQARNSIESLTGPTTVLVGETYDFTLVAKTATNGYEQLETFLTFPNVIFRIDAVESTYSAPVGGTNDKMYADACGWNNDPTSPTYRECIGPLQYSGGKAGGDITTIFTVTILSSGSAELTSLIYDFSGSSYHYNGDYGIDVLSVQAVDSADLSIAKSDSADPVLAGEALDYTLSVANAGPSDASSITVTDDLPAGATFVSASGTGWSCNESGGTVTCTRPSLVAGTSAPDITVSVTAPDAGGSITNSASVDSSTGDPDPSNDDDSEDTDVTPVADLALISSDSPDPVLVDEEVEYTLRIDNHGPSDATNVVVTDTLPAGTTFVSASGNGWTCQEAAGVLTCTRPGLAAGSPAPDITVTVTAPSATGTITNAAEVSADEADSAPGNNDDSEDTLVQAPPPNNPPVAVDDSAITAFETDVAIGVTANDSDADGNLDVSSVQVTSGPSNGQVSCSASGVCTYTPDPGYSGPDQFDYSVCDTLGSCDSATVTITVSPPPPPANNPPVAVDDSAITAFETDVAIGVTANDSDQDGNLDVSTIFVASAPTNGSATCAGNGVCTYTPDPGFSGPDQFDYTVCDTDGACDTATVTITVSAAVPPPPVNNPPIAVDDSALTAFDTDVAISVESNDADQDGNLDVSTVQVMSGPSNGSVSCAANGVCTYSPLAGFSGTDSFDYEICDTLGLCDTATVTITVAAAVPPANNPPVATDDAGTTPAGTAVALGVSANDSDPDGNLDASSVQVTSGPSNGTVTCAGNGVCTYTPASGFSGTDSFDYEICDTLGACDTATVTIAVTAAAATPAPSPSPSPTPTPSPSPTPTPTPGVMGPPVAVDDSARTGSGISIVIDVIPNDSANNQPLVLTEHTNPKHGSVTCTEEGVCTYTPDPGFSGNDRFEYTICDAAGQCDTAVVRVSVVGSGAAVANTVTSAPVPVEVATETLPFTGAPLAMLVKIFVLLVLSGGALIRFSSRLTPPTATDAVRFDTTSEMRRRESEAWAYGPVKRRMSRPRS